ncbi:hypothetical protein [Campylobacter jejuni]|uniref:Uncharacterized protein n=1 Tax=Campylobacter jejuni TaxID=197 RepID=A0A431EEE4_CAMJU|nr:hypothetical protein [Campylobacter jejuni]RTJ79620.1 hypothetical protein C3H57_04415 [Campylobacter jejuni]
MSVLTIIERVTDGVVVESFYTVRFNEFQLETFTFTTDIDIRYMVCSITLPCGYGRSVWIREIKGDDDDRLSDVYKLQLHDNKRMTLNNKFHFHRKIHVEGRSLDLNRKLTVSEVDDLYKSAGKIKGIVNDFVSESLILIQIPGISAFSSVANRVLSGRKIYVPLGFFAYESVTIDDHGARIVLDSYKEDTCNKVMRINLSCCEGTTFFYHAVPAKKEVTDMIEVVQLSRSFSSLCDKFNKMIGKRS